MMKLIKEFNYKHFLIIFSSLLLTTIGWKLYYFLTDDAFISFRYVSNMYLDRGIVWNPEPFLPVEGYTSFLWVVVLYIAWIISGLMPPETANIISLALGYASIILAYIMLNQIKLNDNLRKRQTIISILALLYIITNRTFLTWLSSGLETSLFNYLVVLWVYYMAFFDNQDNKWQIKTGFVCSLLYLTRPDGLLFAGLTSFYIIYKKFKDKELKSLIYFSTICIIPVHMLWRKAYYGDWFPNTYYAKYVRAWPESGIKYFTSFMIEYGYYFIIILTILCLLKNITKIKQIKLHKFVMVIALSLHFLYYTLIIGGDHFEFRVYSHLTILLPIMLVWVLNRLSKYSAASIISLILAIYLSIPIPWAHWYHTKDRNTRNTSFSLKYNVEKHMPNHLKKLSIIWFENQHWLIMHSVCCRHQEHKIFLIDRIRNLPTREEGEKVSWDDRNVMPWGTVGAISWVLPNVAIIDHLGLNDRVISKNPSKIKNDNRHMAHDRKPPPGYIGCFWANTAVNIREPGSQLHIYNKRKSIAEFDKRIIDCEQKNWLNLEKVNY